MKKLMFVFGLLMTAVVMSAQAPRSLQFTFIGNEAVMIMDGTRTLITDFPYESGAFGYMTYDRASVRPVGDVTVIITHGHDDHFAPALLDGTNWRIVAPPGTAPASLRDRLVTPESLVPAGILITPIATEHAKIPHQSYRIEWHGRAMYFTGDTEDPSALLAQKGLDVAFVSPWLWRATQSRKATIDAKQIVIYHHRPDETIAGCSGTCRVPKQGERWSM